MNSLETKEMRKEVKKFVDKADDKVVKMFYSIMEAEQEDDWWDKLPNQVKNDVEEALLQSARGEGKPHEEVMKKYDKWRIK